MSSSSSSCAIGSTIKSTGTSMIRASATPGPNSRIPSGSGRRLRSSTRLQTINDTMNENSISSQFVVKSARLSDTNRKDCASTNNNSTLSSTTNIQDKVAMFMDTIRIAMKTLMQEHGYSRERAKISLLDQLISFTSTTTLRQDTTMMDTIRPTSRDVKDVSISSVSSSHTPSLAISDEKLFNCVRKTKIGMEHATIALTIEQVISSILNDPNSSYTSISEILDTWIQCMQHVQPKPLTYLTMKSSSVFGSPLRTLSMPTMTPIAVQQQMEPTPSIKPLTMQQTKNPPSTPASTIDATSIGKAISSHTRSKVSGKKSHKTAISTPPLSTITIATPPSTSSSQQRSRADSVIDAVSAKITSSTSSAIDGESNQQLTTVSRGKPPLAPNTNGLSSASGAGIASATSLNSSSSSNIKRTNMDSARLEHQQESSMSSLNCGGRPASPSLTLPSSNKRQRRSTSMSSDN